MGHITLLLSPFPCPLSGADDKSFIQQVFEGRVLSDTGNAEDKQLENGGQHVLLWEGDL